MSTKIRSDQIHIQKYNFVGLSYDVTSTTKRRKKSDPTKTFKQATNHLILGKLKKVDVLNFKSK